MADFSSNKSPFSDRSNRTTFGRPGQRRSLASRLGRVPGPKPVSGAIPTNDLGANLSDQLTAGPPAAPAGRIARPTPPGATNIVADEPPPIMDQLETGEIGVPQKAGKLGDFSTTSSATTDPISTDLGSLSAGTGIPEETLVGLAPDDLSAVRKALGAFSQNGDAQDFGAFLRGTNQELARRLGLGKSVGLGRLARVQGPDGVDPRVEAARASLEDLGGAPNVEDFAAAYGISPQIADRLIQEAFGVQGPDGVDPRTVHTDEEVLQFIQDSERGVPSVQILQRKFPWITPDQAARLIKESGRIREQSDLTATAIESGEPDNLSEEARDEVPEGGGYLTNGVAAVVTATRNEFAASLNQARENLANEIAAAQRAAAARGATPGEIKALRGRGLSEVSKAITASLVGETAAITDILMQDVTNELTRDQLEFEYAALSQANLEHLDNYRLAEWDFHRLNRMTGQQLANSIIDGEYTQIQIDAYKEVIADAKFDRLMQPILDAFENVSDEMGAELLMASFRTILLGAGWSEEKAEEAVILMQEETISTVFAENILIDNIDIPDGEFETLLRKKSMAAYGMTKDDLDEFFKLNPVAAIRAHAIREMKANGTLPTPEEKVTFSSPELTVDGLEDRLTSTRIAGDAFRGPEGGIFVKGFRDGTIKENLADLTPDVEEFMSTKRGDLSSGEALIALTQIVRDWIDSHPTDPTFTRNQAKAFSENMADDIMKDNYDG